MKTSLEYLPINKQVELANITKIITEIFVPEMIILFGSYARNEWVEDKYNEDYYRYQSDFDILVIVKMQSESAQAKLEHVYEDRIQKNETIKTPVTVIVHDVDFVNRRLSRAQYFFRDIKKEGILLYESNKFQLQEAIELSPLERRKLAQEDFHYWFNSANSYFKYYELALQENEFPMSAFLLHQITERLYSGILLVFTRYKPNTHDLYVLRKLANSVDYRLTQIFPLNNKENRRLFKLLKKAYVEARYNPHYVISNEELVHLCSQIGELKKIGEAICHEKINSFI